jgi:hypothetical protein
MNLIKAIYEAKINIFCGKSYYRNKVLPKIQANSRLWKNRWNRKKACLVLSYDIDETSDIAQLPRLLALLKKYKINANFAAIGKLVEKYPDLFKKIIKQGHELINHTYSHPNSEEFNPQNHFHKISASERLEEIEKCHQTVKKVLNYQMKGFRIPHFGNQYVKDIYPMLEKLNYRYSSSLMAIRSENAGFPFKIGKVWEFPIISCPKHPFCIFDTSHAFRSRFSRHSAGDFLKTFAEFLDDAIQNNMFINIYHDPQDINKLDYEELLKLVSQRKGKLWITTYEELAKRLRTAQR